MDWHRSGAFLLHEGPRRVVGHVAGVRLGRHGQVDHRLAESQFALRRAEAFVGIGRVVGDLHGTRIGQADILPGHAHDAPGQVARIGTAVEHAAEPVQGAVRVRATHRFVQGRNLVVEGIAALVEAAQVLRHRRLDEGAIHGRLAGSVGRRANLFKQVEQAAGIAVGQPDQARAGIFVEIQISQRPLARPVEQGAHLGLVERLQHIDRRPRQQGRIDLERRVFGRCTDEGEQAALDKRQKAVLLRLVETVDFIDEEDGPPALRPPHLGLGHRLAHFLDAGEDRRQRDELATELGRHHARQRCLAHARRPPEDHRMRLPRLESQAQRLTRPEQVLLADHLVRCLRPQLLGQRSMTVYGIGGKQVAQSGTLSGKKATSSWHVPSVPADCGHPKLTGAPTAGSAQYGFTAM